MYTYRRIYTQVTSDGTYHNTLTHISAEKKSANFLLGQQAGLLVLSSVEWGEFVWRLRGDSLSAFWPLLTLLKILMQGSTNSSCTFTIIIEAHGHPPTVH